MYIANATSNTSYWPTAVTYNGNAMTQIATNGDTGGNSGTLLLYHLAHAGNGSSENVVATWGTNPYQAVCNSISFNNVGGVGSPGYAQDSNTPSTPTQPATLALPGTLILQGFAYQESGGSRGAVTTSGGTADYTYYDSTYTSALTINHASTTQTFTGSTASTYWAGISVALYGPIPVAVTVTPSVSVTMGAPTVVGSAAVTVTPTVSASAVVTRFATVAPTVTPAITATAGVTKFATVTETITPAVSVAGVAILPAAVAITATPSIAAASSDDTSIFITATPAVTAAAVVTRFATVTETVTPTVTTAGVVTEFANVSITATPAVAVGGAAIANIASAITATPAVSVASSTAVAAAITVTPSISAVSADDDSINITVTPSVTAAATVILPASVAVTATPSVAAVGGTVYTGSAAVTATPSVTTAGVSGVVGAVAVTATPNVSVAASISTAGPAYDATGAGTATASTSLSWSHTATAGAYVLVAITTWTTVTSVKYGSTSMTLLGSIAIDNAASSWGKVYLYGLASVSGGAQTVTATLGSSSFTPAANSVSFTNVGSVGTAATAFGTTSPSQSVTCSSSQVILQAFGLWATSVTGYSAGTQRYIDSGGSSKFSAGIATAASTTTFALTQTGISAWGGIAVILS